VARAGLEAALAPSLTLSARGWRCAAPGLPGPRQTGLCASRACDREGHVVQLGGRR
jgi:hypothetical protein